MLVVLLVVQRGYQVLLLKWLGPVRVGIADVVVRRYASTLFLRYGVRCVQSNWWLLVLLRRLEDTSNCR